MLGRQPRAGKPCMRLSSQINKLLFMTTPQLTREERGEESPEGYTADRRVLVAERGYFSHDHEGALFTVTEKDDSCRTPFSARERSSCVELLTVPSMLLARIVAGKTYEFEVRLYENQRNKRLLLEKRRAGSAASCGCWSAGFCQPVARLSTIRCALEKRCLRLACATACPTKRLPSTTRSETLTN